MTHRAVIVVLTTGLAVALHVSALATPPPLLASRDREHHAVQRTATGTFEIEIKPLEGVSSSLSASSLNKTFTGEMQADSVGQMLAMRTAVAGSAGYVAMERITGMLDGQHGSFVLQHSGTMQGGSQSAVITVVPDSGTEGLSGLTGSMGISQAGGVHHYVFHYSLPD